MTGIHGFASQDQAIQESMGPIVDRTRERLGASDAAIIGMRKLLLQEVQAFREGQQPFPAAHGDIYWVRSASTVLKRDVPFEDGCHDLLMADV